jgi:hypothetical protein
MTLGIEFFVSVDKSEFSVKPEMYKGDFWYSIALSSM